MDKQDKLLDKRYLETRIREIKAVRDKEVFFEIRNSDNENSISLYVNFFCKDAHGRKTKAYTLRISDHSLQDRPCLQFIIDPTDFLTKKKKQQFMNAVERAVQRATNKNAMRNLSYLLAEKRNEQRTVL